MTRSLIASMLLALLVAACGAGSRHSSAAAVGSSEATATATTPASVDLSTVPSCIRSLPFVSGVSGVYGGSQALNDPVIPDDQVARLEQPNTRVISAFHAGFHVTAGGGVLSFLVFDDPADAQNQGSVNQQYVDQSTSKGNVPTVLAQSVVIANVLLNVYPNFSSHFQAELAPQQQLAIETCLTTGSPPGSATVAQTSTCSLPGGAEGGLPLQFTAVGVSCATATGIVRAGTQAGGSSCLSSGAGCNVQGFACHANSPPPIAPGDPITCAEGDKRVSFTRPG